MRSLHFDSCFSPVYQRSETMMTSKMYLFFVQTLTDIEAPDCDARRVILNEQETMTSSPHSKSFTAVITVFIL